MEKVVLISGVSRESGLGYETARQMKALGYIVIIGARDEEKAIELASQIGAVALELDVTAETSIAQAVAEVQARFGKLDALINNAGAFFDQDADVLEADVEFIKAALDTNLLGAWRMVKAFMPLMEKSPQPRIVNVSSGAGSFTDPVFGLAYHFSKVPVYGVSKLALNGFTVKLAKRLEGSAFKVNAVDPGFTATYPGTEQWGARPVAEGAKGIVWAATLADDGPSGGFFRDGQPLPW